MKVTALAIARAFVDLARTTPSGDFSALADAAATLLASHGLLRESRTFPSLVERVWQKQEGVIPVTLTTVKGHAGPVKEELLAIVRNAIKRPCALSERADPGIVGGLMLSIGDERFDCTLRGALGQLSARIMQPITLS